MSMTCMHTHLSGFRCPLPARYGPPGGSPQYCKRHVKGHDEMVPVELPTDCHHISKTTGKRCANKGVAFYAGDESIKYCVTHMKKDMVTSQCVIPICKKPPIQGTKLCQDHSVPVMAAGGVARGKSVAPKDGQDDDMPRISSVQHDGCIQCDQPTVYGTMYCGQHIMMHDLFTNPGDKCTTQGCAQTPLYGLTRRQKCQRHKQQGMSRL